MNVRKTIEYWTRSAEYDLEVADSLFENKKYHYALFFGHLAIEKILKGIFVKKKLEHAPFSHSLTILSREAELDINGERLEKLAEFMEFYIEGRYPRDMESVFRKCSENYTREKLGEIKEMYQWLMGKLEE
jgi:HEPN domain-containing protein